MSATKLTVLTIALAGAATALVPGAPRQPFYGAGRAEWKAPMTLPLRDGKVTIGTLKADGVVSITIRPEQLRALKLPSLREEMDDYRKAQGCTAGKLTVSPGARVYRFLGASLPASVGGGEVKAQITTSQPDGTRTTVSHQYWYLDRPGSVHGSVRCQDGPVLFKLKLVPGWNHVAWAYTYHPKTKTYTDERYVLVGAKNSYRGPWIVLEAPED